MKKLTSVYSAVRDNSIAAGLYFTAVVTAVPKSVFAQFDRGLEGGADQARGTDQDQASLFEDGGIFQTITNLLLFLIGAVSVIMLIVGGFKYVLSGGDSNKTESAKNTIMYAIVGIVVAFLAWAAVDFVINALTGRS